MACLVILNGEQEGKYFQLTKRPLAGGRDPATEIQIIDAKVSRRHFQVRLGDAGYTVRELRSRNGVFVNGTKIEGDHLLSDGDEIGIGDTILAFYKDDNPERTNALEVHRRASRNLREDRTLGE